MTSTGEFYRQPQTHTADDKLDLFVHSSQYQNGDDDYITDMRIMELMILTIFF